MNQPQKARSSHSAAITQSRVILAYYSEPAPQDSDNGADRKAKTEQKSPNKSSSDLSTSDERESQNGDKDTAPSYTAPRLPYQQLAMAIANAVDVPNAAVDDASEVRRELVDSLAFSSAGPAGRLGLVAPPSQIAGRVTSRPGLQDGPATGLGFASRDRNIFLVQANRLTGASGRCHDLAAAGFFGGSRAGCERTLRR